MSKPSLTLSVEGFSNENQLPSPNTATRMLSDPLALLPPMLSVEDVEPLLTPERSPALSKDASIKLANRALNESISSKDLPMLECVLGPLGRRWVNVDLKDNEGSPMIVLAAALAWLEGVISLVKTGADVDAKDSHSWTALHWATLNSQNQPEICSHIISFLLQNGASPLVKSRNGRTAKDIAPTNNDIGEILEIAHDQATVQSNSDLFSLSQSSATPSYSGRTKQRAKDKKQAFENMILKKTADILEFESDLVLNSAKMNEIEEDVDESEYLDGQLVNTFDWSNCLPHQMLIITPSQISSSIDVLISLPPHPKPISYESSPGSALFLWQRYAFYVGDTSGELASTIFDQAIEKIEHVLYSKSYNLPVLAFWLHNVTLWLYFIKSDNGMNEKCTDVQDILCDFVNEIYVFIVRLVESKMDLLIDPYILDFDSMPEFDDIRFDGEWRLMRALTKRKNSTRKPNAGRMYGHRRNAGSSISGSIFGRGGSTSSFADIFNSSNKNNDNGNNENGIETLKSPSIGSPSSFDEDKPSKPRPSSMSFLPSESSSGNLNELASSTSFTSLANIEDSVNDKFTKLNIDDTNTSPKKVTQLLNSTLIILEIYNINEALIVQIFSQIFYWTACEIFNRIILNKKYFSRSRATMIRFNLSAIEDWVKLNKLPISIFNNHFATVTQMLQWLSCLSAMSDFSALISTLQTLRQLNPKQLSKLQREYKHEAGPTVESRMSGECVEYLKQLVVAWDARKRQSTNFTDEETNAKENEPYIEPKTQNHIDNLYPSSDYDNGYQNNNVGLGLGLQPPSNNRPQEFYKDYVPPPVPENVFETVDSRFMLPFELPSDYEHLQWRRKHTHGNNGMEFTKPSSPHTQNDDDLLSIPNSRPPSRASSNTSVNAHTIQCTIIPDVPEDILTLIDKAANNNVN